MNNGRASGCWAAQGWGVIADAYARDRGRNTRKLLFVDAHPPPEGVIPGIPFMPTQRARELVRLYHLH